MTVSITSVSPANMKKMIWFSFKRPSDAAAPSHLLCGYSAFVLINSAVKAVKIKQIIPTKTAVQNVNMNCSFMFVSSAGLGSFLLGLYTNIYDNK